MVVQHLLDIHYMLGNKNISHEGSKDELDLPYLS